VSDSKQRVYLVDASIYIFRAYYSVPDTLTNSAGKPINALHGFAGFLGGFLEEVRPQHLAVVFDESLTTSFRNDIFTVRVLPHAGAVAGAGGFFQ
jgi:5'-3' exonuclease